MEEKVFQQKSKGLFTVQELRQRLKVSTYKLSTKHLKIRYPAIKLFNKGAAWFSQGWGTSPYSVCMHVQSLQSCLTLCDPMDCSPPGSSVHGILQARILEWVAIPSSRESSPLRDQTHVSGVSCTAGRFFTLSHQGSSLLSISSVQSLSRVRLFETP